MSTFRSHAGPSGRPASIDAVLTQVWDASAFTATDAMTSTGLTRTTAIDAIDALIDVGLLRELPNARETGSYRKGRPARRFQLRSDAGAVVGIDAGRTNVTAIVADLQGKTLATGRRHLSLEGESPKPHREDIVTCVDQALVAAGLSRDDVWSLCAGVPAPVMDDGTSPLHPEHFWQVTNPDLIGTFGAWVPLVHVDNDAALAAMAEGVLGTAVGRRNYLAILAGERMGTGVVVDGRLLRGAHGGVGEMIALDHVKGIESTDGIGAHAATLARAAVESGDVDPDGALAAISPEALDGQQVLNLALAGDPDAERIAQQVGTILARTVAVLSSMFDPELVVICGAVSEALGPVIERARTALPGMTHLPPAELAASSLGGNVVAKGAIAVAVRAARDGVLDLLEQQ